MKKIIFLLILCVQTVGCSSETGSEGWCADQKEKPKGDWTTNETTSYAQHCLFK